MDKFEKWFSKVNEDLAASPTINTEVEITTDSEAGADTDRNNIMGDVDTIMTSLETLASELTEELNIELEDLNEAGKAEDFIKAWIIGIKATNAQNKVNKVKMNVADLSFAADKYTGDKKKSFEAKYKAASEQSKELQTLVDNKFKGAGGYVEGKLAAAKIEGQLAIIKRTTGMEDDPSKKSKLKEKMTELVNRYKEEVSAIKSKEDDNKEAIATKKKELQGDTKGDAEQEVAPEAESTKDTEETDNRTDAEKQADAKADSDAKVKSDAKAEAEAESDEPEATDKPETETSADKIAQMEADIKAINDSTEEAKKAIVTKTKELEQAKRDVEVGKGSKEDVQKIENRIEEEKEDIKDLKADELAAKKELKKMSAQESLIYRATEASLLELATEISEKAEWQLDNTVLYTKYNTIIKKAENDSILTESNSIKDRFNTLLNS